MRYTNSLLLLFSFMIICLSNSTFVEKKNLDSAGSWGYRFPYLPSVELHSVAHGNNEFVMVGSDATILATKNGGNGSFTLLKSPAPGSYRKINYVNGHFLLSGINDFPSGCEDKVPSCVSYISKDARSWTESPISFTGDVAYSLSHGFWVGINKNQNKYFISSDGTTWEQHNFPDKLVAIDIEFGNNRFLVIGKDEKSTGLYVLISNEMGTSWSKKKPRGWGLNSNGALGYALKTNLFISSAAHPNVTVSNDGEQWFTVHKAKEQLLDIKCSSTSKRCVGISKHWIIESNDGGETWKESIEIVSLNHKSNTQVFTSIGVNSASSSKQVESDDETFLVTADRGIVYRSRGYGKWLNVGAPLETAAIDLSSLTFSTKDNIFISTAESESDALFSEDSKSWKMISGVPNIYSIASSTTQGYLSVVYEDWEKAKPSIYHSNDGKKWNKVLTLDVQTIIFDIKFINNKFIIVGEQKTSATTKVGFIIFSSDGVNFDNYPLENILHSITYSISNKKYFAGGVDGIYESSDSDLQNWENLYKTVTESGLDKCVSIAAGSSTQKSNILAICSYEQYEKYIVSSNDGGVTWEEYESPCKNHVRAVAYCDILYYATYQDLFFLTGKGENYAGGALYSSSSGGNTWNVVNMPYKVGVRDFVIGKGDITLLSRYGSILSVGVNEITYTEIKARVKMDYSDYNYKSDDSSSMVLYIVLSILACVVGVALLGIVLFAAIYIIKRKRNPEFV